MVRPREHAIRRVGILLWCLALGCVGQNCVIVPASKNSYGQDGPWGAVTVNFGGWTGIPSDMQPFDFLPGGYETSYVLSPTACSDNSTGLCGIGGMANSTFDRSTIDNETVNFKPTINYLAQSGAYLSGSISAQAMTILAGGDRDSHTVLNTSTTIVDSVNLLTFGNKNSTAVEVGFLALGGGQQVQSFGDRRGRPNIDAWTLPGYLYNQSETKSFSYTLQIGLAALGYPVSLVYGGYDRGRMIGPPTVVSDNQISLLDIGIGVYTGGSPFQFPSKERLLVSNDSAESAIKVTLDPLGPYLSLPKETCDAIANELPVKLDPSGYYLWRTDDPRYNQIISSPAYLSFTFPSSAANSAPDNVIIKVPFKLLNLTLGPLLSGQTKPVPYFPCKPFDASSSNGVYFLGRAFLQAAFIGRPWSRDVMWLAQAPGPGADKKGLGQALKDISESDDVLEPLSRDQKIQDEQFNSSWSDYWHPLPDSTPSNTTGDRSGRTGLSTGAKAGIGGAIGAVALVSVSGWCFWMLKKKKNAPLPQTEPLSVQGGDDAKDDASPPYSEVNPMHFDSVRHEMNGIPSPTELSGGEMRESSGVQDARELGTDRS